MDKKTILKQLAAGQISRAEAKALIIKSDLHQAVDQQQRIESGGDGLQSAEIAIIGVAGQYPKANTPEQLWQLVASGAQGTGPISVERRDLMAADANLAKQLPPSAGMIDGVDQFDPLLFKISPKDATVIDPQDRLFLQTLWSLFENSGYPQSRRNDTVGLYVGACFQQYHHLFDDAQFNGDNLVSSFASLAGRASQVFNLNGPSIAVDTACSSSMMALHQAIGALRYGECEMAVTGGVNLSLHPHKFVGLRHLLASGSVSKPYGDSDGYISSEGVGAILLKPLAKAQADGDFIYATIKSSVIGHAAASEDYCVPSAAEQARLVTQAIHAANLTVNDIDYVEGAAMGSPLADAAEFSALQQVFDQGGRTRALPIGSVKAHVGHCEAASTMAQLTKVLMQLKHRQLPKHINFENPNSNINFDDSCLHLNLHDTQQWQKQDKAHKTVLINATGAMGAYGALVLSDQHANHLQPTATHQTSDTYQLVFCAHKAFINRFFAEQLLSFIHDNGAVSLQNIAYSLERRKISSRFEVSLCCQTIEQLQLLLRDFIAADVEGNYSATAVGVEPIMANHWQDAEFIPLPNMLFNLRRCWFEPSPQQSVAAPVAISTSEQVDKSTLPVVVIGAGAAGLAAAKCLKDEGFTPMVLEKSDRFGGIWTYRDNYVGGPYASTRTQNSKFTFFFSDFPPDEQQSVFSDVTEVNGYLKRYIEHFDLTGVLYYNTQVLSVQKSGEIWQVTFHHQQKGMQTVYAQGVLCCSGEFWRPKQPQVPGLDKFEGLLYTSNVYHDSSLFKGKKVLVIGAGVSGADIASDAAENADSCFWSVRGRGWFLPRMVGFVPNDCSVSFIGRIANLQMSSESFKQNLTRIMPQYMEQYEKSGLIPTKDNNNIIHINERVVPYTAQGDIQLCPEPVEFDQQGVRFADGRYESFDVVICATGYHRPQYEFLKPAEFKDFYEHIFYREDPSLAICNHPPGISGFGAALPYFELIARWFAGNLSGRFNLPKVDERRRWCADNADKVDNPGFFDTWTESLKVAAQIGALPDARVDWLKYWQFINMPPIPSLFRMYGDLSWNGAETFVEYTRSKFFVGATTSSAVGELKIAILAGFTPQTLDKLQQLAEISAVEKSAALNYTGTKLSPLLEVTYPHNTEQTANSSY